MFPHTYFPVFFYPQRYFPELGFAVVTASLSVALEHQTTVKSWFQSGDAPTQAQFSSFIESSMPEWQIDVAIQVGSGSIGIIDVLSAVSATTHVPGAVGLQILQSNTTAAFGSIGIPGWVNNTTQQPAGALELLSTVSATTHPVGNFGARFLSAGTTAVSHRMLNNVRYVTDFGATGDGTTDDTAAIKAAEAACSAGETLFFPTGTYNISATVTVERQRAGWMGAGWKQSVISWVSGNATSDIIVFGDGSTPIIGCDIKDIRITATTTMATASHALRLREFCRSRLNGICIDGQDGSGKLANGIYFEHVDHVTCTDFECRGRVSAGVAGGTVGVKVAGGAGATAPKADLYLRGFKISSYEHGVVCGGAFGGLYLEHFGIIANRVNMRLDETLTAENNREIFVGIGAFDSPTIGPNVDINQPTSSLCWIQFDGTWSATSPTNGIEINSAPGNSILINNGRHYNNTSDGIKINDTNCRVSINNNFITNNTGWGINTVVSAHYAAAGNFMEANVAGNMRAVSYVGSNSRSLYTIFHPTSAPTGSLPGLVFFDAATSTLNCYDGTNFRPLF